MKTPVEVSTPSDTEVRVVRSFNAPRTLVFDAVTKPEFVKRWLWGPDDWRMSYCEIDFRVGGKYRYIWSNKEKGDMPMGGVYKQIDPPKLIVCTELFDPDWTEGETLVTWRFIENAGRTTVDCTVLYSSKNARDNALKSGMTEGWGLSYDHLDELLDELRKSS